MRRPENEVNVGMNKKILSLLTAFVIIVLPLFSVSAEAIKPAIRLSCSVDGSMPSDKKFEITVKKYAIDETMPSR